MNTIANRVLLPAMTSEHPYFPVDHVCPWCKSGKVNEPHSMAILNGGAMKMSPDRNSGSMDDSLDGFLTLIWHGAHDSGVGDYPNAFVSLDIANNCGGGQFEMYFCSTKCLREFLCHCVDRLEAEREKSLKPKLPEE